VEVDASWLEPASADHDEETLPPPGGGKRNTIPVEVDWLEPGDDAAKPRPSSRPAPGSPHARPSPRHRQENPPPLPTSATDYSEDAQRALHRLRALHPARDNERLIDELQRKLKRIIDDGSVKVTTRLGQVVLIIAADAVFVPSTANVSPAGTKALGEIAAALSTLVVERFQVEGHTPAAKVQAWLLCASQAIAVARRLAASGISSSMISLAAFGELSVESRSERHGIAITILRGDAAAAVENR